MFAFAFATTETIEHRMQTKLFYCFRSGWCDRAQDADKIVCDGAQDADKNVVFAFAATADSNRIRQNRIG